MFDAITNSSFIEVIQLIGILLISVVGFIITGIVDGCVNNKENFDLNKLLNGMAKAFTACAGLIIISYTFTVIDLSSIGFYPKTIITAGIIVYTGKLVTKSMRLLGLNITGKELSEDSRANDGVTDIMEEFDSNNLNSEDTEIKEINLGEDNSVG